MKAYLDYYVEPVPPEPAETLPEPITNFWRVENENYPLYDETAETVLVSATPAGDYPFLSSDDGMVKITFAGDVPAWISAESGKLLEHRNGRMADGEIRPVTRIETILDGGIIEPIVRFEYFLMKALRRGGGSGITDITKVTDGTKDIFTIEYSDGTSEEFELPNLTAIASINLLYSELNQTVQNLYEAVLGTNGLSVRVQSLETYMTDVRSRLSTAESNITTLQGQVSTLQGQVSTLQDKVAALEEKVPSIAFIPCPGGVRIQMDNTAAIQLADANLGRPVAVSHSGTLTGGDASDAVEWIAAVLAAKALGKNIQVYSPDYAYLTEVCYYKHSDSWIELNFSRPGFEDLTYHYDYNMGYFVDVNATNPAAVDYKVTTTACATRFA